MTEMKIVAVLESIVTNGGAFNQGLNAIMQMDRICEGRFEFEVLTTDAENIPFLEKLGIACVWFKPSLVERVIARANRTWHGREKTTGLLEKKLLEHGADLVYFLTP